MEKSLTKWVLGHSVTAQQTSADYDLVIGETPANTDGPPPHSHNTYTEMFIIIQGEMEFLFNDEKMLVKAGESINLPPKSLHTFRNKSEEICKWANIHSPKGFLKFFEALGVPEDEPDARQRSLHQDKIQEVLETASNYDMQIILQS